MSDAQRADLLLAAIDQLPLLVVVAEGEEQRVAWVNVAGQAMAGERALGAPMAEWHDVFGEELAARYLEVWRTGESYTGREWRLALERPDGTSTEHYLNFVISPVRWPDGTVRAVAGFGSDVTDLVELRLAADARARTSEHGLASNDVVVQLQDAMLPKGLPVPQGAEVAARYLLADDGATAGGDWFDAVALDDGRLVVAVGDVVGHGVEASVVMGELRTIFEDRVREDGDVAAALRVLHRRALRVPEARAATICAAVFDSRTGELTYCTAGHPPPVVVDGPGRATFLPGSGGAPLGSGDGEFPMASRVLEPGELVVLYSDGLVERPGRSMTENTMDLLRVAEQSVAGSVPDGGSRDAPLDEQLVGRVCRQAIEVLTRVTGHADDITVLALQRTAPVGPLRLVLPAISGTARAVRVDLHEWLRSLHVSALDELAVQHAVNELVTNAVDHAYREPDLRNEVRVDVHLGVDGVLAADVADTGDWDCGDEDAATGGRGLAMARALVDDLDVDHGVGGTTARIRHRLAQPAMMLRGTSAPAPRASPTFAIEVHGATLSARGDLDQEASVELRRALDHSSRGGTRPVVVDLSGVGLLASAGVQVLVEALAASEVRLVAPPGCAAQHVLELVRLPYQG